MTKMLRNWESMSKTQNYWSAEKFSKWVIFHKKNCWPWVNFIQLLQGILNLSKKSVLFSSFWFSVCFGLRYFTPFLIEMFYSKIVLISNFGSKWSLIAFDALFKNPKQGFSGYQESVILKWLDKNFATNIIFVY